MDIFIVILFWYDLISSEVKNCTFITRKSFNSGTASPWDLKLGILLRNNDISSLAVSKFPIFSQKGGFGSGARFGTETSVKRQSLIFYRLSSNLASGHDLGTSPTEKVAKSIWGRFLTFLVLAIFLGPKVRTSVILEAFVAKISNLVWLCGFLKGEGRKCLNFPFLSEIEN